MSPIPVTRTPRRSGVLRGMMAGLLGFVAIQGGLTAAELAAQGQGPAQVVWEARDESPAVAFSIHLPVGALADPPGQEGTAFLFGRVLEAEAASRLAPLSGQVLAEVTHEAVTLTVQVAPAGFEAAWRAVSTLLAGGSFSEAAVEEARERLLDEILFEAGAPVRAFELEWYRRLSEGVGEGGGTGLGASARPVSGTVQGVSQISAASLNAWRAQAVPWSEATAGVVGTVSRAAMETLGAGEVIQANSGLESGGTMPEAQAASDANIPAAGLPGTAEGAAEPPPPAPLLPLPPAARRLGVPAPRLDLAPGGARQLWTSPDRRVVDQEITSTWIGMAWALPRGTPWALRDFLAHVVSDALNPTPPDPGLYRATVQLQRVDGTPLLVVIASVDPQSALDWEARILRTLEAVAENPPEGAFFDLARRRYRSTRLLESADPALQARWLARQVAEEGRASEVVSESWGLTRAGLATLADARGAPRILLYGPARMMTPP